MSIVIIETLWNKKLKVQPAKHQVNITKDSDEVKNDFYEMEPKS